MDWSERERDDLDADYEQRVVFALHRFQRFMDERPLDQRVNALMLLTTIVAKLAAMRSDCIPLMMPADDDEVDDMYEQLELRLNDYLTILRASVQQASRTPPERRAASQRTYAARKTRKLERWEWLERRDELGDARAKGDDDDELDPI